MSVSLIGMSPQMCSLRDLSVLNRHERVFVTQTDSWLAVNLAAQANFSPNNVEGGVRQIETGLECPVILIAYRRLSTNS